MNILLTGVTGFVDGAIAANLAVKGLSADTHSAVRGDTLADGLARLRSNLRRFESVPGTLNAITESQIVPFDLHEAEAAELGDPEVIVNCTTLATFSNHPSPWETNAEGVLALGRSAAQGKRLKRFMQISMAMSYSQLANRHVSESWSVPTLQQHVVSYTYSRGTAELKLREAVPELPLVVVRSSIAAGHSTLGCEPSGSIFWMLHMVVMLEALSCRLSDRVDILPVDDCTEGIVQPATKPTLAHDLYHISADDVNSERTETLHPRFKRCKTPEEDAQALAGYVYQEKITEKVLARKFLSLTGDSNVRPVARCIHLCAKFVSMGYVFDNTQLVQETDFQPRSLLAYFDRCPETSDVVPILEQTRWDYRWPSGLHGLRGMSWRRVITIGALHQDSSHHNKGPPMTLQALAHLNITTLVDSFTSLISAFALGSLIGSGRQVRQRTAGLCTNALVAVAALVFVDMAVQIGAASGTTRVIVYVMSSVGFLGAGTIMRGGLNVYGLDTAATFWGSVAVGTATGFDLIGQAIFITPSVLASNILLRSVVDRINRTPPDNQTSEVTYTMCVTPTSERQKGTPADLERLLEEVNYPISDLSVEPLGDGHVEIEAMLMSTAVNAPELDRIMASLQSQPHVVQVLWNSSTIE